MGLWLSSVAPVLKSVVTSVAIESQPTSPAKPWSAEWRDRKRPLTHPGVQAEVLLQVTNVRSDGQEPAYSFVAGNFKRTLHGQRYVTLQVQARSWKPDEPFWALEIAERIRTKIWTDEIAELLYPVNCGIIDIRDIVTVDNVKVDDRILSVASLDIIFSCGMPVSEAGDIVGYFDHVKITGHVANPAGTEYPVGVNWLNETIGPV